MTFTQVTANVWRATDGNDTYEIVHAGKEGYGCFKNRSICVDVTNDLHAAMTSCETEQIVQEWHSNNPENEVKNRAARNRRNKRHQRPKLWRGK